jgi:hypothetical protein
MIDQQNLQARALQPGRRADADDARAYDNHRWHACILVELPGGNRTRLIAPNVSIEYYETVRQFGFARRRS